MADILGYARVSTDTQELDSQRTRLKESGAIKIFEDIISGKIFKRPGLD
jgi:DNA invertase Pin-like site-specific DNA recombinase